MPVLVRVLLGAVGCGLAMAMHMTVRREAAAALGRAHARMEPAVERVEPRVAPPDQRTPGVRARSLLFAKPLQEALQHAVEEVHATAVAAQTTLPLV